MAGQHTSQKQINNQTNDRIALHSHHIENKVWKGNRKSESVLCWDVIKLIHTHFMQKLK